MVCISLKAPGHTYLSDLGFILEYGIVKMLIGLGITNYQ